MSEREPMHNLADTYAKLMLEPLHSIIFLVGLYKGSMRDEHLKSASDWVPKLESTLACLKRELTNDR